MRLAGSVALVTGGASGLGLATATALTRAGAAAALVRHICENPMLNGEVIRLDGAIRMAPR